MITNALRNLKYLISSRPVAEVVAPNPEALQKKRVLTSGLFDPDYYAKENPDVLVEREFLIDHFIERGGPEGRSSHPLFDPRYYSERYKDVSRARINPLFHYLEYGGREGRRPHPLFDAEFYQTQLSSDEIWERTPLEHFLERGAVQGLDPNPWFSVDYYRTHYSRYLETVSNPLHHYITEGVHLGLNPHPLFITNYYIDANADVAGTGINPLQHFLLHGLREGRDTNPLFDASWYGETFGPEGKAWPESYEHYCRVGAGENFDPSPALSTEHYLRLHKSGSPSAVNPVDHLLRRFEKLVEDGEAAPFSPLRLWLMDLYQAESERSREGELISVIVPCFNQGRWIEDALLTAHLSTRRPLDIIIVDDGSTDQDTVDCLPPLAEKYGARLISQANCGLSGARNTGLRQAKGEYVQFLDSDDLLLRGKIDQQLALGKADLYLSDYYLCNSWCGDWRAPYPSTIKGFPFTYQSFLRNWERGFSIPIHCGLFAKSALEGFEFDTTLKAKEDWLMWLAVAGKEPNISFLDSAAVLYRQHSSNMGRDSAGMGEAFLRAAFRTIIETENYEFLDDALKHFRELYVERIREDALRMRRGKAQ